ncbi:MAG: sterol carrier protein domain-containing protein, partial [Actinomycetota bacterium]|nr:sterol carrier protein domain-containing protein [Actinomycetota bacterium]
GWEHAGTFTRYRLDARLTPAGGPPLRAATDGDWPAIRACHDRAAQSMQGPAVRPDDRWAQLRASAYRYVLDSDDAAGTVEAYALFDHSHQPGEWRYTLSITDWAATTPRGLRALVGLVGSHGSIGKDASFRAAVPEPWSLLLTEQDVEVAGGMQWMARGLDLPNAIAARGFPPGLAGSATLSVDDPLIASARGPWRLEVADGRGQLLPAERADVRLDVRAVGPLFSGFRDPATLVLAGLIDGPADALAWLAGAFAGPLPLLLDFF